MVTLNLEVHDDNHVSVLIEGGLYQYRSRLDEFGVAEAHNGDNKENIKKYRILRNLDVSVDVEKIRVFNMLGDAVFKNLVMRLIISADVLPGDSFTEKFLNEMRKLSNLHS